MTKLLYRTIIAAVVGLVGSFGATAAQPGAAPQRYAIEVKDFTELTVIDGINVDYKCSADSAGWAVFDATPEVASQIMFEYNKGKLKVQLPAREMNVDRLPTVTVYSRYLLSVENDGDSLVRVLSVAPCPRLKATLVGNGRLSVRDIDVNEATVSLTTGNGQIVVTGRCSKANLRLAGTGSITADGLAATQVSCRLAGTGTIGCAPAEQLSVSGIGSGTVYYQGNPEIKKRMAPGIHVEPLKTE